jgi:TolB-like protein
MKSYRFIFLFIAAFLCIWGCTPSYIYAPRPTTYVKQCLTCKEVPQTLMILPFESPSYFLDGGVFTAKLFYERLLQQEEFTAIYYSQNSDWFEKGMSWHGRTELAIEEGRRAGVDYILIGSIDYYLVGHITTNRVTVTARLIEVMSGETMYFATGYGSGKPGKTFLLLDAKPGEFTPSPTAVLSVVVNNMVRDYFRRGWFSFI